jgi:hypothetical protein
MAHRITSYAHSNDIIHGAIDLLCFQKLSWEKTTLAGKFQGALAKGKVIPDKTLAFACSIVSA